MIVSINQPAYLPWLGYVHRVAVSDLHIVLDHVQFEKNSFANRNRIRTATGWCWLTVPVATKGRFGDLAINQLRIADVASWRRKHWDSLRFNYAHSPWFGAHAGFFESLYARTWRTLAPLMTETTNYVLEAFGIETKLMFSSQMDVAGARDALVLNLCAAVGADAYLSGPLGRDYLDAGDFRDAGIELRFHDYLHPEYTQVQGGFEPFMAAVDLLFNHGPDSAAILRSGQKEAR